MKHMPVECLHVYFYVKNLFTVKTQHIIVLSVKYVLYEGVLFKTKFEKCVKKLLKSFISVYLISDVKKTLGQLLQQFLNCVI